MFDPNVMFELPKTKQIGGLANLMQGMDKRHDGYPWCEIKIINIKNGDGLTFTSSPCISH